MGKPIKYTKEILEKVVAGSVSYNGVIRLLGARISGGLSAHLKKRVRDFGIDTSHFLGQAHNRGKVGPKRPTEEVLVAGKDKRTCRKILYRCLLELKVPYLCALCDHPPVWRGMPLMLQIDHINGDWSDDRAENLRFLCPHCHTQQPTFCNKRRTPFVRPSCEGCGSSFAAKDGLDRHRNICKGPLKEQPSRPHKEPFRLHKEKANWPTIEELRELVWSQPVQKLAASLAVSEVAVKKRCNRLGIATPPRGYWAKLKSGQFWPPDAELQKLVWTSSFREVGEILGITADLVGVRCRERNIQTPPHGHWNKKHL